MMRSMYAASSGLRNHQIRMDVIGTNIANVNTIGYKKSRVTFRDALYQTIRGASAPQDNRAGTNPQQIGLGNALGSVDVVMDSTSTQNTGKSTDLAIQGDGFFILSDGGRQYYTRAGTFDFDTTGSFYNVANGFKVMGYLADPATGVLDTSNLTSIDLAAFKSAPPKATDKMTATGNLPRSTADGDTIVLPKTIYDSQGGAHDIEIRITKTAATPNEWTVECVSNDSAIDDINITSPTAWTTDPTLVFDSAGNLDLGGSNLDNTDNSLDGIFQIQIDYDTALLGVTDNQPISINLSNLTQYDGGENAWVEYQNGYGQGDLRSTSIDITGAILATYSNGQTQIVGQVAIASFQNPSGLLGLGNSMFQVTPNSGDPDIGAPGTKTRGSILPGNLEMSNVDLSLEFTDMISTQRGFQANSRIITASDEMLQELVNLKR